ncbi:bifunctional GNAT family N-acetyltransferase/hotdog fold thioesterase [Psychrosphaera sp. B3R10]|uniref:Bifunctional GNAT family N-acetyltransferase/hotdog fold thioesterase n=1 Tax=Psychrosphaera algicola TaxID=3023714 RepID=A0ABT5FC96_9GAMM|nr:MULTISPECIES: bifunctional GNAT family N-acetyltransferase/hotdog fold thioesterase [unclassified Psychrosphaera]MBU2880371.1 bifunctional GNAT family N-acetyltransferase/hotdog fold thioesterase [Psychrosphaera sp. I2R16]MBU2987810.1 bifunctional GNAT family N-acetyltransferase/hotdog fold thioesterase [Psychrosphaera sp. B3R10]MDC2889169.1 bifunctional GNAT family N-acetyltransferase/hotdog fold thioesterase [Psychrosphaera sp. G1-22]MDO6720680.1 bifunctional GNAT family N-acetyltransferas
MYQVVAPHSEQEWEQYYEIRWQILRAPLQQPRGSEKDEYEQHAWHRMVKDEAGNVVGVARLHLVNGEESQIRYMAVTEQHRRKGLATMMLESLEAIARQEGVERVILNARTSATNFYENLGYVVTGDAPEIFGAIPHVQMCKSLETSEVIIRNPHWCVDLQNIWHQQIPITQLMGIRVYQYTGTTFETRAALNPNMNLHGTMFAGSIYSLATLTGWGLVHLMMKENDVEGDLVLADATIHYHKPVTELPRAVANFDNIVGDFKPLLKAKMARIAVQVEVLDDVTPVAKFTGQYVVVPKGGKVNKSKKAGKVDG